MSPSHSPHLGVCLVKSPDRKAAFIFSFISEDLLSTYRVHGLKEGLRGPVSE